VFITESLCCVWPVSCLVTALDHPAIVNQLHCNDRIRSLHAARQLFSPQQQQQRRRRDHARTQSVIYSCRPPGRPAARRRKKKALYLRRKWKDCRPAPDDRSVDYARQNDVRRHGVSSWAPRQGLYGPPCITPFSVVLSVHLSICPFAPVNPERKIVETVVEIFALARITYEIPISVKRSKVKVTAWNIGNDLAALGYYWCSKLPSLDQCCPLANKSGEIVVDGTMLTTREWICICYTMYATQILNEALVFTQALSLTSEARRGSREFRSSYIVAVTSAADLHIVYCRVWL